MTQIYYLSSCDTCKRILKEWDPAPGVALRDIKKEPLQEKDLEALYAQSGSYEALFNKRARLYKERNLNKQELKEEDYRALLLEHYTFLKRPVLLSANAIFIGNSKKTVAEAKEALHS